MLNVRPCPQIWYPALRFTKIFYRTILHFLSFPFTIILQHFIRSVLVFCTRYFEGANLMKKAICILLVFLMTIGTLAGCGKDNANETTTASTVVETTAAETTTSAPVLTDEQILALSASDFLNYLRNMDTKDLKEHEIDDFKAALTAKQFLTYIKNKKIEDVITFLMREANASEFDQSAYSFFNDVVVDSFTISPISSLNFNDYKVTLSISKSSNKTLPVGTSRWLLSITDNAEVYSFRRANDTSTILEWFTSRDLPDFCYDVTYFLTRFKTMNNFNKLVPDAQEAGEFDEFCKYLIYILLSNSWDEDSMLKRSEAEALAKKTFGITNVDFTKFYLYNSADDTLRVDPAGYGHIPATLASVTSNGRIRTVVLDYYSDDVYFLKAKTMEYVVRINDDDSLTMLSTRLVYDSGFPVYEFFM